MAGRKASFTQADIERAIRALQKAGVEIGSVGITAKGELVITAKGYEYDPRRD